MIESFSLIIGGMGALLAALLALLTIIRRFVTWFDQRADPTRAIKNALLESGLIKQGTPQSIWPNGSDNLPDFLEHLWQSTQALHEEINAKK